MIELNEEQKRGYDLLMQFFKSKDKDQMFCLKGYAGTGKTFLISRFVEDVFKEQKKKDDWFSADEIAMTAPTNKAVQVLRQFGMSNEKICYKTIHSLLGLKEVIKDSGEIEFEKEFDQDAKDIKGFFMIIIDEVSMLNDKLFFEIKRYNNEIKIIMMGDPAQIPPVGKIDCEPFLNPSKHGIIEFQLTKIMRQADESAIVSNSFRIRNDLENDDVEFNPGFDLDVVSSRDDRETIKNKFISSFKSIDDCDLTKVVAWTNAKVLEYNNYIRKLLFGDKISKLMNGERMIMNKPFNIDIPEEQKQRKGKHHYKKEKGELLTTNQEITITSFAEKEIDLQEKIRLLVYVAHISFISNTGQTKTGTIKIMHEKSLNDFNFELEKIKQQAIRSTSGERKGLWKKYYDLLRTVADVNYAYAITAHKSQGSTYDNTFVDVRNISYNNNVVERNRILYTALTRAKKQTTIIV